MDSEQSFSTHGCNSSLPMKQRFIAEEKFVVTDDPNEDNPPSYYFNGYITYVLFCMPLTFLMTFIPEWNTGSELYADFYERRTFYTQYFSLGKFLYWMILAPIGFAFVVTINLDNERRTPFTSRDGSFKDIKKLMLVAPILFFASANIFLRDTYDMRRDCPVIDTNFIQESYEKGFIQNWEPSTNFETIGELAHDHKELPEIFDSITKNLEEFEDVRCHTYTRSEVFWYNFVHLIFFFLGLNFTHLDQGILQDFTLDWEVMKNWPAMLWGVFISLIGFLIFTLYHLFVLYRESEVLGYYLIFLVLYISYFVIKTWILGSKRELHIHHYVLGFSVVLFCGYQSYYVTILGAIFTGIFIEGISRWGFDPIWE
ncbi:unnamed protein product [Moneuplotes crassus]|uniref:Uncharacterized protein n=1 Tax=Euplotes crassus TaxID=5936 RepID=A0AAD1XIK8_EUPCR|nr:unnamed protein product [Moneuplotes crassus]